LAINIGKATSAYLDPGLRIRKITSVMTLKKIAERVHSTFLVFVSEFSENQTL
jgi:hypothetical protein